MRLFTDKGPSRETLAYENRMLREQLAKTEEQVTYWRVRAERLMDEAAAKAGLIAAPVMEDRSAMMDQLAKMVPALGGAGMREVDSSKFPTKE
jgi:hypothetical protein